MSQIELQHWGISFFNSLVRILSGGHCSCGVPALQQGEVDDKEELLDKRAQFLWLWYWQGGDSLPALLTPFDRAPVVDDDDNNKPLNLATGLSLFPAISGLYKHSSTRVHRVALDWLPNNIYFHRVSLI